jgi:hypothetical protein
MLNEIKGHCAMNSNVYLYRLTKLALNLHQQLTTSSAMSLSVRLLSSVAVVGRDNEPIYLRGDLCNTATVSPTTLDLDKLTTIHQDRSFDADETSVQDASVIDADAPPTPREPISEIHMTTNNQSSSPNTSEEDSDPFGFFTENSHSMSLTNQLVLHASLDRFEEMTRNGASRWRMPGSQGANAMWMGRLCEVEERWNVYGE